jgi:RNA polymerase sigma-70 factor (ECF subfamily)
LTDVIRGFAVAHRSVSPWLVEDVERPSSGHARDLGTTPSPGPCSKITRSSHRAMGSRDMPERSTDSSVDLLRKAQLGDRPALEHLLARYLPRLRRWASGRLPAGARSLIDTGDLVQDAMIAACRHLDTLEIRHEGAVQAYLRKAVQNRIIDAYRRSSRRPPRTDLPEDAPIVGPSALDTLIGEEMKTRYETALLSLSADDRDAIVLRLEQGSDYADIARRLKKPTADAARMTVVRALARLAREMRRG